MITGISIIICTYNRDDHIIRTLESLKSQTLGKDLYEILVIDNNSTDRTGDLCKEFIRANPVLRIKYFIELKQGLSAARNRGIRESEYEIVAFTDDDAVADGEYLENLQKTFAGHPEISAAGGKVLPVYPGNKEPQWLSKYLWGLLARVDLGNRMKEFAPKYPAGCNMAFRKEIFTKYGFFNENIKFRGDEKYVFLKLKKGGEKIIYNPGIVVHHTIYENRISREGFRKICINTGESEMFRLMDKGMVPKIVKFAEYCLKLFISLFLGIGFLIKGQYQKAAGLVRARLLILKGYVKR